MRRGAINLSSTARLSLVLCGTLLVMGGCERLQPTASDEAASVYVFETSSHPDGTGKFYMGREIAAMTTPDPGAAWLERPERERTEFPNRVVQALGLRPTDQVADIGAGTGYFTFRLSPLVPDGKVWAVDIQPEMLQRIRDRMGAERLTNIEPVLGTERDPNLPEGTLDVVLIVFSYTEFSHPYEMIQHIASALKVGGRLVMVEYRDEDATIPVGQLHKISVAQARREMEVAGLVWVETREILPQQHFMVFEKPLQR